MEHIQLEKLIVAQLIKKLPALYTARTYVSCSQDSPAGPYPEPAESIHTHVSYLRSILSIFVVDSESVYPDTWYRFRVHDTSVALYINVWGSTFLFPYIAYKEEN
jgi:hypothetical protein